MLAGDLLGEANNLPDKMHLGNHLDLSTYVIEGYHSSNCPLNRFRQVVVSRFDQPKCPVAGRAPSITPLEIQLAQTKKQREDDEMRL